MYTLRKTTITPNYFTKHWALKKVPSNKPKKQTKSNHNGENMKTTNPNAQSQPTLQPDSPNPSTPKTPSDLRINLSRNKPMDLINILSFKNRLNIAGYYGQFFWLGYLSIWPYERISRPFEKSLKKLLTGEDDSYRLLKLLGGDPERFIDIVKRFLRFNKNVCNQDMLVTYAIACMCAKHIQRMEKIYHCTR